MKKLVVLLLAAVFGFSVAAMAGCKKAEQASNDPNSLDIVSLNKGYGIEWINALIDGYQAKNPDVKITFKSEVEDTIMTAALEADAAYDLYFTGVSCMPYIKKALQNPESALLENLTSVYNATPDGTPIKDTMNKSLLDAFDWTDGNGNTVYYTMPWNQGVNGLLVNEAVVEPLFGENWREQYPCRTTEEMFEFCEALKSKNTYAFIHSADSAYYYFAYEAWWAQYEGVEGIADYYSGMAMNAEGKKTVNDGIFLQQGRQECMKVMERMMDPANKYDDPASNGYSWNDTQIHFMEGDSAMFVNGDWHSREMSSNYPQHSVVMMKLPVISALGTKLGITEEELQACVDYADALSDGETLQKPALNPTGSYTADEVIEEVCAARTVTHSLSNYYTAFVPAYSPAKEIAKDFLIFMASQEGQKIYAQAMNGLTQPYGYDISKDPEVWNEAGEFEKSRFEIAKDASYCMIRDDLPLGGAGLVAFRATASAPIEVLLSRSENRMTAQEIVDTDYDYYHGKTTWTDLLRLAGIYA